MLATLAVLMSLFFIKTDSQAAKKSFRALGVTNGFMGERTNFTLKYKNGRIILNGTMNYLKGNKGFTRGKKVKFKNKKYKVANNCTYHTGAGSVHTKKVNFKKYFKKKKKLAELQGYISITVKNNKVKDVYVTD